MFRWFYAWRERRKRMQWFADEFLPELMTAAGKLGNRCVANAVVQAQPADELPPQTQVQPVPSAQSIEKLHEVLQRLPDSERERLKAFVQSRGSA